MMFGFSVKCIQPKTFWVFLDVDGVLNCEGDWCKPFALNNRNVRNFLAAFESLKGFCEPSVILTSSWRRGWNPADQPAHLKNLCKVIPVKGVTPVLDSGHRGHEVERVLSVGHPDGYVVIDDDPSDLEHVCKILVSSKTGFTSRDAQRLLSFAQKRV